MKVNHNDTFICNHNLRVLVQHLEMYSSEKHSVKWHIPSRYSCEMTKKSEVVSVYY